MFTFVNNPSSGMRPQEPNGGQSLPQATPAPSRLHPPHLSVPDGYTLVRPDLACAASSLMAPTVEQLSSLRALPRSGRLEQRRKPGKIVSRVFNPQADRPMPLLKTPATEISVTLMATSTAFTTSTSVPTFAANQFALQDFGKYTAYTGLFDQYRISAIEVWLNPSIIMSSSVGSTPLFAAVDFDDANTPVSGPEVYSKQGAVSGMTGDGMYLRWNPHVAVALYSGVFTSFGSEPSPWIDCASPAVQHYGIKYAVPAADGLARLYTITTRAVIHFRGPAV